MSQGSETRLFSGIRFCLDMWIVVHPRSEQRGLTHRNIDNGIQAGPANEHKA